MTRTTYVWDKNQERVVPAHERTDLPMRQVHSHGVMPDITNFVTQDGTEITSRSKLRDYERSHGVRQCGSDWTGSEKPAFWDSHVARERHNRRD